MENSTRFLAAFNRIDQFLGQKLNGNYKTFTQRLREISKSNATVRRYHDDLSKFAELRNTIVHDAFEPGFIIAEPHASIVKKIEAIEYELIKPLTVYPKFQTVVTTFKSTDTLCNMLNTIREKSYSQFPIYKENKFIGLVTENGLTNWLAKNVETDIFSLDDTLLEELVAYEEERNNYLFISKLTTLDEAEELFRQSTKKGFKLDALLITENGRNSEKLLGIITIWDFIEISGSQNKLDQKVSQF